jgi:hypothetical protein
MKIKETIFLKRLTHYLLVVQHIVEAKQLLDDGHNFAWRQKPSLQHKQDTALSQYVRTKPLFLYEKQSGSHHNTSVRFMIC